MKNTTHTNITRMHAQLAYRNNASSEFVKAMAQLGKPLNDAISSGLMTLNAAHAPIYDTCIMYANWLDDPNSLTVYDIIPGFGSSWYKEEPDPVVNEFIKSLPEFFSEEVAKMEKAVQHLTGKNLYTNAALATALAASLLSIPPHMAMSLVISGRIDVWNMLYQSSYVDKRF